MPWASAARWTIQEEERKRAENWQRLPPDGSKGSTPDLPVGQRLCSLGSYGKQCSAQDYAGDEVGGFSFRSHRPMFVLEPVVRKRRQERAMKTTSNRQHRIFACRSGPCRPVSQKYDNERYPLLCIHLSGFLLPARVVGPGADQLMGLPARA